MSIRERYAIRRKVGVEIPDPTAIDLHKRLPEGTVIFVFSGNTNYTDYMVLDSEENGMILSSRFNIYFRPPDEEEMALIALRELA